LPVEIALASRSVVDEATKIKLILESDEPINSMFHWYEGSDICDIHLEDLDEKGTL
jgi:hypothetical protein